MKAIRTPLAATTKRPAPKAAPTPGTQTGFGIKTIAFRTRFATSLYHLFESQQHDFTSFPESCAKMSFCLKALMAPSRTHGS